MTSITANDVASGDPCSSLSMNQTNDDANPSKTQQVYSRQSIHGQLYRPGQTFWLNRKGHFFCLCAN